MTQTGEKYNWISSVPYGWKLVKLKYLSSISTGVYDTQDKLEDGAFPFFVRSPHVERIDKYSHDCEAVMTAGDGVGVGKVFHYYNGKFAAHQRVYVFNQFKNNVNGKYIYYSLMSNLKLEVLQGNAKSTVDSLRYPMLSNFPILLPSSSTQNIIVDFLERKTSEIDTLISDKEKLIALLEEKRQAIITEAVTKGLEPAVKMKDSGVEWIGEIPEHWGIIKLKYLFNIRTGGTPKSNNLEYWDDKGIIWITPGDLSFPGDTISDSYKKISESGLINSSANYISKNSIVISTRAPIGNMKIATMEYTTNQGCKSLESKNENHNIIYYFNLLRYRKNVLESLGQGTTFLELSSNSLKEFEVPVMNKEEQDRIVEVIQSLNNISDKLLVQINKQIYKLKEYRQALIYEAVTGKIDVQEMVKETEHEEVSSS